ncbi:MAG: hypothetical protein ACYTA3_04750, partial [Planctomycetota bacterium]
MTRNVLLILVCCLWGVVTSPVGAVEEPLTLRQWARAVWESANEGDLGALEGYLSKIPEPPDNEQA